MNSTIAIVLCFAYILGLLLTAIPFGSWLLLGLGTVAALMRHRVWKAAPSPRVWLFAGAIGLLASLYFQLRMPQPQPTDISRLLAASDSLKVLVEGEVTSLPHTTRSQKAQIWLSAQRVTPIGDDKPVTGKLYTTIPLDQAKNLHPGQIVKIAGSLYLPKPAANPGGFDFKHYLQGENSFAGLNGERAALLKDSTGWSGWQIQQRIADAQLQGLGNPEGALVSAMVLGSKAIDLPYSVKDAFVRVGLAHALAASGFQTSLILGVVLALTRRLAVQTQFIAGSLSLASFVGLAGLQPAVLRAALMGFGGLVALIMDRKVKPLGSLLLTATVLLLVNPLWMFDLGFQLSFLATMGLLVTVSPIVKRLDWMPSTIAPLVAVPIAAYLWTLPLQLWMNGVLSPYSIFANLVTTPFISVISLGGMVSALASLVWLPAGSASAWLLKYPTQALIAIVNGFGQLPGNAYAIGTISVLTILILYGLLGLSSFHPWWQRRWKLALAVGLVLLLLPLWSGATSTQATLLATSQQPLLVLRDRGRTLVLGNSDAQTAQFTLLPYLQKTGVNQIDWAIATDSHAIDSWNSLAQKIPVKYLLNYPVTQTSFQSPNVQLTQANQTAHLASTPLQPNQTIRLGSTSITLLNAEPTIAQFTIHNQTWLWLGKLNADQLNQMVFGKLVPAQVLVWTGKSIPLEIVAAVKPTVAIAAAKAIEPDLLAYLQQRHIQLYVTGQDGALQWTPANGFTTTIDAE